MDKKNDKQLVNNYRPISLLPIFGKMFEKITFNKIYNFLLDEKLLNPDPSGSCINQLSQLHMKYLKLLIVIYLSKSG